MKHQLFRFAFHVANFLVQRLPARLIFVVQRIYFFLKESLFRPAIAFQEYQRIKRTFPDARQRIILDVWYELGWSYLAPLYRELVERKNMQPMISIPLNRMTDTIKNSLLAEKISEKHIFLTPGTVLSSGGIFITTRTGFIRAPRRCTKIQMFHDAGFKSNSIVSDYNLCMDHVFLQSRVDKKLLTEGKNKTKSKAILHEVGNPKLDALFEQKINKEELYEKLHLRKGHATILYAPTWNPPSSLHKFGLDILDALTMAQYNILVRLHPFSLDTANPHYTGGVDWKKTIQEKFKNFSYLHFAQGPVPYPYFHAADILISDISGIIMEYAAMGKPIIRIQIKELEENPYNRAMPLYQEAIKELLFCINESVFSKEVLCDTVNRLVKTHSNRQEIVSKFLFNPGKSAYVAVEIITQILSSKK